MVVEDSAVIRRLLAHIIAADPRLELAAAVESAEEALLLIPRLRPDVVSMDVRLPGMDGLEATRRIMARFPTPIVVIADAVEDASLRISMNALRSGALAVLEKPRGTLSRGFETSAARIATQLAIMSEVPVIRLRDRTPTSGPLSPNGQDVASLPARGRSVLAIAASTGGPPALAKVLGALPPGFSLPVLLVQHMGASFMEGFAHWLDGVIPLAARVARDGDVPEPGTVLVAPGSRHLTLRRLADDRFCCRLSDDVPVNGQRPSATVLFNSVADAAGPAGVGVLLTGMGEDGATGLVAMRRAGAYTITEHESTAVVYGMPAAAVAQGGSCASLPLDAVAQRLLRLAGQDDRPDTDGPPGEGARA
ncbi:chemotaxis-specific protein-glutamate methyltransferase CheB [Rhizosaccharibacter radicis]|uniref:Protein-glutamate methylesterase/protein-glutamine glutaminase n=1 Tax=Rhizosaccharibacter radicis TaxID=2782605 RepID=A0ABT1VX76_9PROT|nr:chemotaxis-specific protein-glutamate methyltransferase CheB [Acetobacteraceae bacterium KSS12]